MIESHHLQHHQDACYTRGFFGKLELCAVRCMRVIAGLPLNTYFNQIAPHVRAHAFICASKLRFSSVVTAAFRGIVKFVVRIHFSLFVVVVVIVIVMHSCSQY